MLTSQNRSSKSRIYRPNWLDSLRPSRSWPCSTKWLQRTKLPRRSSVSSRLLARWISTIRAEYHQVSKSRCSEQQIAFLWPPVENLASASLWRISREPPCGGFPRQAPCGGFSQKSPNQRFCMQTENWLLFIDELI